MSLEDFKEDFERDYQAQEDQRDAANEDMRFVTVDGGQWEGWLEDEDRTKLEFDITSDYVDRFIGREEINSIGIKFEPDQGDASEEDAELLSGLYLKDYSKGDGEIATLVAKREAVTCGVGAFRFMAMPADEEDPESPLKVVHRPIYSAHSTVVWDSGSKRQDKADAKRVTILIAFTRKGYEKAYPEFPAPVSLQKQDRSEFNWSTQDLVYVAERIHIERNPVQVYLFVNPVTKQKQWVDGPDLDSIEDELFDSGFEQSGPPKKIIRREVFKTIFHGNEILEKTVRIPGKHLTVDPRNRERVTYRHTSRGTEGNVLIAVIYQRAARHRSWNVTLVGAVHCDARATSRCNRLGEVRLEGVKRTHRRDLRTLVSGQRLSC
jgi:hypothetical protein